MLGKAKPISVFISHRHRDEEIANTFREAMEGWSNGAVQVFQSSHVGSSPAVGAQLDESIAEATAQADIVLLLYTTPNADWSWCMYECGLAQDPTSMKTRIVVFHTTEEAPAPLRHLVTVPFSEASIHSLVDGFHRDPSFFPRQSKPIARDLAEDQILERATELYRRLAGLIPQVTGKEVQRYDHLTVTLALECVRELQIIDGEKGGIEAAAQARALILENAKVVGAVGEPHAHFNFETLADGLKLSQLIDRWRQESDHGHLTWPEALVDEMARALLNRKERAVSVAFNSLAPDTTLWLLPVVSHYRVVPFEDIAEFDVLLVGIAPEAAERMILPPT